MNRIKQFTAFKFIGLWCLYLWLPLLQAGELVTQWQNEARRLQLAQHPYWLHLLHAERDFRGNTRSQVDDDDFFLAAHGKEDMQAELLADIRGFIENNQTPSAQCRFPARFYWLKQQLQHLGKPPETRCRKFIQWRDEVGANRVSLVFPSMYLNNPASMFGHTFLRLDKQGRSPLLSYTLSYTARTNDEDSFFSYAYKGLSGGYPGYFTTRPYYETIQEYGDMEHRDIWEYDLDLNQEEVDQMLRHLWELSGMNVDYFFLRENCAYRLLAILDVARPGLDIIEKQSFPFYAIPVDTVKAVLDMGMVRSSHYRPSISSRLQQMYQQLDEPSRSWALSLSLEKNNPDPLLWKQMEADEQAKLLEFAAEIRRFKKEDNGHLLLERSQLAVAPARELFVYQGEDPVKSHDSARWGLSPGQEENHRFVDFSIRPAFHDLLDPSEGFLDGAAISGLSLRGRWFPERQLLKLQSLELFSMSSLSPVSPWSTPWSGRLSVGWQRYPWLDDSISPLSIHASLGLSKKISSIMVYGLVSGGMDYSNRLARHGSVYLGGDMGLWWPMDHGRLMLSWRYLQSVAGLDNVKKQAQFSYQYDLSKQQGLRLQWEEGEYLYTSTTTALLSYLYYF